MSKGLNPTTVAAAGLALLAVAVAAPPAQADQSDADKIAAICAEADARYQELYGDQKLPDDTVVVTTYGYVFCPPTVTVKAGTTVRWVNIEKRTNHNVWLKEAGKEESPRFFPEETWEVRFDDPGEYPYICTPHIESHNMAGKVIVTE